MGQQIFPYAKHSFRSWKSHFLAELQANAVAWNLDPVAVADFAASCAELDDKIEEQRAALTAARAAKKAEDRVRSEVEAKVRSFARQVKAIPGITDAELLALGLKPRDRTLTRSSAPNFAPQVAIVRHERLAHILRIRNPENPESLAKPPGVVGCEVWRWIGPAAPPDISDYTLLGVAFKSRYEAGAKPEHAGQTAWYRLRWITTRGEVGTWSAEVVGMILG